MSFGRVDKLKEKQISLQKSITQLPKKIAVTSDMLAKTFRFIDELNNSLEKVLMFDVDPDLIEPLDNSLKGLKSVRMELTSSFSDIQSLGEHISNFETVSKGKKGDQIEEALIQDVTERLQDLDKRTLELMPQLGTLFNSHFEKIEKEVESTKIESTISSEIFAKIIFDILQNSIEMISEITMLPPVINDITLQLKKSIDDIQKNQNMMMDSFNKSLQTIQSQQKEIFENTFQEVKNEIFAEIKSLDKKITESQQVILDKQEQDKQPVSRDEHEMDTFLRFLYQWPTDKNLITRKIEEFRDLLLIERDSEAPYRVTASSMFREAIGTIQRVERDVDKSTLREVISIMERLQLVIKEASR
ncbi:MAG: hypothetical protein ACXAC7_18570 [Candidatus Hodarchaeales archaeon]|jgi:hypothetical protein